MGIAKNFVVKNGLEVNSSLIVANSDTNKVGIASTGPRTTLDVRGGIGGWSGGEIEGIRKTLSKQRSARRSPSSSARRK